MTPHEIAVALREAASETLRDGWMHYVDGPEGAQLWVAWLEDGTVKVQDTNRVPLGHFTVAVLVEPATQWRAGTWRDVAELFTDQDIHVMPTVRLGGQEAAVESAVLQRWHVDPDSNRYRPIPLEHEVVRVVLSGRGGSLAYNMPPTGPVEYSTSAPIGPAVSALAGQFDLNEVKEPS
jgi:hypothetical protein